MRRIIQNTGARLLLALLCLALGGTAVWAEPAPMTPDVAAKATRVKRQQSERITLEQRRAAAAALKAERQRVHKVRQDRAAGQNGSGPAGMKEHRGGNHER